MKGAGPVDLRAALEYLADEMASSLHGRGASYRRQAPRDLELGGGLITCEIRGSARRPYTVVIDLEGEEAPAASCSCPYSDGVDFCKHTAAVVDVLLDSFADPLPDPRRTAAKRRATRPPSDPLVAPLARIDEALRAIARASSPETGSSGSALLWEVTLQSSSVAVTPILRRRLKSGGLGAQRRLTLRGLNGREQFAIDPRDRKLVSSIRGLSPDHGYSNWGYQDPPALQVLELLEGQPLVFLAPGEPVELSRATPGLIATPSEGATYSLGPALDGRPVVLGYGSGALLLDGLVAFDGAERRLRFAPCSSELGLLFRALAGLPRSVSRDVTMALVDKVARTDPSLPLALPRELEGEPVEADTLVVLRVTPVRSGGAAFEVRSRPIPGGPLVEPGSAPARLVATIEGARLCTARDLAGEVTGAREACKALGLAPDESVAWTGLLESDDEVLDLLARLDARSSSDPPAEPQVLVEWPEGEKRRVVSAPSTAFKIGLEARQDWFGLEGGLEVEGELIVLGVLLAAAREGRRYVSVGRGRFVELAKVFGGRLEELALLARENRGAAELPRAAAPVAAALLEGVELTKTPASWRALTERVRGLASFEPAPAPELKAELRPYQVEGYRWLRKLEALGVGGCLADDMGTGKTVQTIAALLDRRAERPALVVAPTSVGFNWMR
jgi:hypothetical protein